MSQEETILEPVTTGADIEITIRAGSKTEAEAAMTAVRVGLDQGGFSDVTFAVSRADETDDIELDTGDDPATVSALDVIREQFPEVFEESVSVVAIYENEVDNESEDEAPSEPAAND